MTATLHEICVAACCATCVCGAPPGKPCDCQPGRYHLARFAIARRADNITGAEFASVIHDGAVDTPTTCILDPEVTP
jgi:hypothetical protein